MGMTLPKNWHAQLKEEIAQPYIQELKAFLEREKASKKVVYPPEPLVFHAFTSTPFEEVKVVIMGQDPYHGPGQAHGLSFSVPCGIRQPPSLQNIFKEIEADLGIPPPESGCLSGWAKQGVLLLNATLTVRAGEPRSHYGKGWERFTDAVIAKLVERKGPLVFLLWGKSAQEKCAHLLQYKQPSHLVLTAAHPSPYSVHQGFFGCRHFSKANAHLEKWGTSPIAWLSEKGSG
jgi:uracil-DNA glycosylase